MSNQKEAVKAKPSPKRVFKSWHMKEVSLTEKGRCGWCKEPITYLLVTVGVTEDGQEVELDWPHCPYCQGN